MEKNFYNLKDIDVPNLYETHGLKVGNNVVVGEEVMIGEDVTIGHNVIIGTDVTIGHGTKIGANVEIRDNITIGNNCKIDSGVIMTGLATVEDNVVLRNHVVVARGSFVGSNTFIAPKVMFNNLDAEGNSIGGATVGKDCFIGTGAVLQHGIEIADGTTVGACSFVSKDINKAGVYLGVPAKIKLK